MPWNWCNDKICWNSLSNTVAGRYFEHENIRSHWSCRQPHLVPNPIKNLYQSVQHVGNNVHYKRRPDQQTGAITLSYKVMMIAEGLTTLKNFQESVRMHRGNYTLKPSIKPFFISAVFMTKFIGATCCSALLNLSGKTRVALVLMGKFLKR